MTESLRLLCLLSITENGKLVLFKSCIKSASNAVLLTCFLSTGLLSKDYRSLKTQFLQVIIYRLLLDVLFRPLMSVTLCLVDPLRVTARITCSRSPTSGNWGCWWSSSQGKHWPWWRAKWANWSMTKQQVMKQSCWRSNDHMPDVSVSFFFHV